jgi:Domain of unknown function (DUF4177)
VNDKRWAYQVIEVKPAFLMVKTEHIQEKLNQMGQSGWELVNVIQSTHITLYFKRPL